MQKTKKLLQHSLKIIFGLSLFLFSSTSSLFSQAFVHPGILNNKSELDFIKDKIKKGEQPWKQAFDALKASNFSSLDYKANPKATMDCWSYNKDINGNYVPQCKTFVHDAMAAYSASLMWYFTEDKRYSTKAIEIINAWSNVYVDNTGSNARLNVSWATPWYVNAAEILRHGNSGGLSGWTANDINKFNSMLMKFMPKVKDDSMPGNNWIQSAIEAHFSIAIFMDNRTEFNLAVSRWKTRVKTYIYQKTDGPIPTSFKSAAIDGICMETRRDLGHIKLGVNSMFYAAQSAYVQGVDLFSLEQKRIADFLELHGSWMTGAVRVPSNVNGGLVMTQENHPETAIYPPNGGGGAAFEIAYNHLHSRLNRSLPYTTKMIGQHRPASAGQWVFKWETLTHGNLPFNITVPTCVANISTSGSLTFCMGENRTLTANTGSSYKWLKGTTIVGNGATYIATTAGSYTVEVTNASGCKAVSPPKLIAVTNPSIWYRDTDSDGKGEITQTISSCTQPNGYVALAGDGCPTDPSKIVPGLCGCGVPEGTCLNNPPIVSFGKPTNNTSITAPATLIVNVLANDIDGIKNVQLFLNGVLVRQETTAPYDWNHTGQDIALQNMPAGIYTLKAVATDMKDAKGTTEIIVKVTPTLPDPCNNSSSPSISLSSPTANSSFNEGQIITLISNIASSVKIEKVEFYKGSALIGTDITSPYSYNLPSLTAGTYSFSAKVIDSCGKNSISLPVIVTVKPNVVNSDPIQGVSCGKASQELFFTLNPDKRTNAQNYSWWFTGSSDAVIASSNGTGATVKLSQYFSSGAVCVGVNLSIAPYYVQYCKDVVSCSARIGQEENVTVSSDFVIYPNPTLSDHVTIDASSEKEIPFKIQLLNSFGEVLAETTKTEIKTIFSIAGISQGTYSVKTYFNGRTQIKKLVIIK